MSIALLLNSHLKGMSITRAVLIMPTTVAPIVVGFLFRYLYAPEGGLLSWILKGVGFPVPPEGMLGNSRTSLLSIGMADTWQWTPFFAIVLYAGLLAVPGRYYRRGTGGRRVTVEHVLAYLAADGQAGRGVPDHDPLHAVVQQLRSGRTC